MAISFRTATIRLICALSVVFGLTAEVAYNRAYAQKTAVQGLVSVQEGRHAGDLLVPVNKSQILRIDQPYKDLLVGNSKIADVLPLTNQSVYVLGKKLGSTSLSIYGPGKVLIAVVDLTVGYDVQGLKTKLFEMMPEEKIEVRAVNQTVILTGTVSSSGRLNRVLSVAQSYAPKGVRNLLKVAGSQQVMLEVRFAEMSRNTAKEFGVNFDALINSGNFAYGLATNLSTTASGVFDDGTFAVRNPGIGSNSTNSIVGNFNDGTTNISGVIDALENKGLVKVLAEPNLIALSGETARFLAGGEFPIPVAQGDDSITIEFKEFGVGLAFTPTVLDDGLINLAVAPEVSQIDPTASITTQAGVTIPALTTRRANTTVELRDGQSFAIAGLLQSNFSDGVRQLPWIGDVPVLGALTRSSRFQRAETELVIIVTPRLVKPAKAGTLASPTDTFTMPSEFNLFVNGSVEGRAKRRGGKTATGTAGQVLGVQNAGGIDGSFGHIMK